MAKAQSSRTTATGRSRDKTRGNKTGRGRSKTSSSKFPKEDLPRSADRSDLKGSSRYGEDMGKYSGKGTNY